MASELMRPLVRRAQMLEYFTVSWNVLESVIAIAAGVIAEQYRPYWIRSR